MSPYTSAGRFPGLRILHVDPLVISVERFFTSEECDELLSLQELRDSTPASLTFGGPLPSYPADPVRVLRVFSSMHAGRYIHTHAFMYDIQAGEGKRQEVWACIVFSDPAGRERESMSERLVGSR